MTPQIRDGERLIHTLVGVYAMLLGFLFIQGVVGTLLGVIGLIALVAGISGMYGLSMVIPGLAPERAPSPRASNLEPEVEGPTDVD